MNRNSFFIEKNKINETNQLLLSQNGLSLPFCCLLSFPFPEFSGERFSLLRYKTHYSEVVGTERNAGKSEFSLFVVWLTTFT